jgi:cell division septal protein FtsQ
VTAVSPGVRPARRFRPVGPRRGPANRHFQPGLGRRRRRRVVVVVAVPLGAALVFLAGRTAFEGELFRVREVGFRGLVNAQPRVLVAEAGLARKRSIFDDLSAVRAGLLRDPLVRAARVRRELPGRLVVEVEERRPAAYWSEDLLWPLDAEGKVLPLDPAHFGWDLPILMAGGRGGGGAPALQAGRLVDAEARALLRLVIGIRDRVPEISRRISVAELGAEGRVSLHLMGGAQGELGEVRLRLETPIEKVALLADVIRDLELKRMGFESLDLSFADQIVVRPAELPGAEPAERGGARAQAGPVAEPWVGGEAPQGAAGPLPGPGDVPLVSEET